jgi:hypothetical protein
VQNATFADDRVDCGIVDRKLFRIVDLETNA